MSSTGPALPTSIEEDNAVVERFIDASREIVPTCQVTLAKRIIRPGSNRVLCLAAHTSVPLDDETLASVSDLALKLSDGTNVRLSLSFFNDDNAGSCIPLTRSIYDPNKYDVSGNSRLGAFLIATCIVALSGIYVVTCDRLGLGTAGPLQKITNRQETAVLPGKATGTKARQHNMALLPAPLLFQPSIKPVPQKNAAPNGNAVSASSPSFSKGKRSHNPERETNRTKRSNGSFKPSSPSSMFVPPPPPMALPPIDPSRLQIMNGMFPESWMISPARPAVATPMKQEKKAKLSNLQMPAPAQARDTTVARKEREPVAVAKPVEPAMSEPFPAMRAEAPPERMPVLTPGISGSMAAPLPGADVDYASLQLERIRL